MFIVKMIHIDDSEVYFVLHTQPPTVTKMVSDF